MYIYYLLIMLAVIPPIVYKTFYANKYNRQLNRWGNIFESVHIFICFFTLWVIASFRGDFTSDYNGYVRLFDRLNQYTINEVLNPRYFFSSIDAVEPAYAVLNILIGTLTNNSLWLFIISSAIIILPIHKSVNQDSKIKWLSILLYIVIGTYFDSFNIMRQIMAASVVYMGIENLYKKDYARFSLYVLFASLFHITALIFLGFYFILLLKPKRFTIFVHLGIGVLLYIFMNDIVKVIDVYIYSGFYTANYAGFGMQERAITNALVPIAVGGFVVVFRRQLEFDDIRQRVWFNGSLLWVLFEVLSLKIHFITRIASFFSLFTILIIPTLIMKFHNKKLRVLVLYLIVSLLLIYFLYYGGPGYEYYTIWKY